LHTYIEPHTVMPFLRSTRYDNPGNRTHELWRLEKVLPG